jgi:hypothetical protein
MNRFTKDRLGLGRISRNKLARVALAAACVGAFTTACDVHGISGPGTLASISITPDPQTLAIGGTQQFTAVGKDFSGATVTFTPVWSVATGGGTIGGSGMFTAGTLPGTFTKTITATSGGMSATATIIVTPGPLATIVVTPNPATMGIGASQQFAAVGKDAAGNVVPFVPTWSVVAGGGTVNATGLFTAGTVSGSFANTVQASSLGIKGTATVTVTAGPLATITVTPNPITLNVGVAQQFAAVGKDASGNIVAITPVWSVVASGGAIDGLGVFTAGATPGTFTNTIRAVSGTTSGFATVTVTSGPLATITVTPNSVPLPIGGTQQFTAVGKDASGNVVAMTPVWAVVAGGGSVDLASGLFTAGNTAGTFTNTVRASSGTIAGFASVIVTAGGLSSITVSPNPTSVAINGTQQFTASGRDAGGNVIAITPTWAVVNGGGTITSGGGLFTAGVVPSTFTNTIQATVGGVSGFATVTVTPLPTLATIVVTPNPASLATGAVQRFVAVGRDANGNVFAITPVWSTAGLVGGTINPATGDYTAAAPGTYPNEVRATVGTIVGTASVTVTAAASPLLIDLKTAAPNGIMAGTAVTCVSLGTIFADISISPGGALSGFPPCIATGTKNLANAVAAQAQLDLTDAYNALAAIPCTTTIVANLGGTTLNAGTYCSATTVGVTGVLTLDGQGNPNAKFVIKAGTGLTTAGDVVLIGQAQAKNVYWLVGSSATLGTASQWQGNIITLTSITMVDNATLVGRALARQGAVTLGTGNTITLP